jgi:hypothetical protein
MMVKKAQEALEAKKDKQVLLVKKVLEVAAAMRGKRELKEILEYKEI